MIKKTNGIRRKSSMIEESTGSTKEPKRMRNNAKGNPNISNKGYSHQNVITKQQVLFCHEFVSNNFNGTKAAISANYSKRSAAQISTRLLKQDKIQSKINEIMQKKMSEIDVTTTEVVQELKTLAFSDITKILKWDNKNMTIIPSDKLAEHSRCIKTITFEEKEIPFDMGDGKKKNIPIRKVRIELHDKLRALELIGRNLKMFTDKVEMSGNISCLVIGPDEEEDENKDSTADTRNETIPRNHPKHYNFSKINAKRKAEKLSKDDNAS